MPVELRYAGVALLGAVVLLKVNAEQLFRAFAWPLLMALGGTGFIAASAIGGRAISSKEQSAAERIEAWSVGLELLKWRPLFGAGYGNFTDHHHLTAHNSFVLCFAELGLNDAYQIKDLWQHKVIGKGKKWSGKVLPHETKLFRLKKL